MCVASISRVRQQAAFDQLKKRLPGVQTFTEDRDRLIRFYGNGSVAVASFFRYTTTILPPMTPPEVAKEFGPVLRGGMKPLDAHA